MPVTATGEPKKHFIAPAWYVGATKTASEVNMKVTWEQTSIPPHMVPVPILVNTRAVKAGEVLKRADGDVPTPPPAKKSRMS